MWPKTKSVYQQALVNMNWIVSSVGLKVDTAVWHSIRLLLHCDVNTFSVFFIFIGLIIIPIQANQGNEKGDEWS